MFSGLFVHILQREYTSVNGLVENGKNIDIQVIYLLKYI